MKHARGWTLVELVIVIAITAIMSGGIAGIFVPQVISYFQVVGSITLQSSAADCLKAIIEGDPVARGLRFADPSSPLLAASGDSLTYRYYDLDQTSADTPHQVVITYDATDHVVTRSVDGGAADYIPYYVKPGGNIRLEKLDTDLFQYFDTGGSLMTFPITLTDVERIELGVEATYASGVVSFGGARTRIKTGVFIKRNS